MLNSVWVWFSVCLTKGEHLICLRLDRCVHGLTLNLPSPHSNPGIHLHPHLLFLFFIEVNDVSGGRRQGRSASFLKSHHPTWSTAIPRRYRGGSLKCELRLFPPHSLSRPMQVRTTGRANKHLYIHLSSDRWNKTLTGLKSSLTPQTWPPQLLVQSRKSWAIN